MVKERNYLIETLKSSGIKSQVYTNMKKLKAGNEVHVGAVLRNGETFARSGSKKTYIDQEGQRKRRVKLWDRSTSLHIVIADTSEEKVEEILENFEDYVNAMLEERKGINNIYMQVVCSNSRYQRMDGRVQDINNAGIVTGLYGRAKESQSIGEVKSFPISEAKLLKLLPEGIEDYIETLDKAKYVTIRQYIGKEDYYVTSANMMSPEGSDYSYAEDVRVSNRLVKAVRAKALDELQVEVDPGDIETSITNIQEQINTPVEDAVRDKVISSGSVTIDTENLNILVDEKLDINITYVPMGHVREMNLTFAVENPYAAS